MSLFRQGRQAAKIRVSIDHVVRLRELIAEPVKDGQGEAVKALIVKYNGTKLSDIPAVAHAAFAKDVEALTF